MISYSYLWYNHFLYIYHIPINIIKDTEHMYAQSEYMTPRAQEILIEDSHILGVPESGQHLPAKKCQRHHRHHFLVASLAIRASFSSKLPKPSRLSGVVRIGLQSDTSGG